MKNYINKLKIILTTPEIIRYLVVGFGVFLIDFSLLLTLIYVFKYDVFIADVLGIGLNTSLVLDPFLTLYVANIISSGISMAITFTLNRYWTFGLKSRDRIVYHSAKFALVAITIWLIHNLTYGYLVRYGFHPAISKLAVMSVQVFISFVAYKFIVFK